MSDMLYDSFVDEWNPKYADILADLEYDRNLANHLVTTEVMYMKLNGFLNLGMIREEHMENWKVLGFSILSLQHRIYNIIPDFPSKQRAQLLALSKDIIKEERFHNDVVLSRGNEMTENEFLKELKSKVLLVKDAIITPDKTLKIILRTYVAETLEHVATVFAREVDSHGLTFKMLVLYDEKDAKLATDVLGIELFVKPL